MSVALGATQTANDTTGMQIKVILELERLEAALTRTLTLTLTLTLTVKHEDFF